MTQVKQIKGYYSRSEWKNINKYHPAISHSNCRNCGGYQTILVEFDKYDMTTTYTCKQCGDTTIQEMLLYNS